MASFEKRTLSNGETRWRYKVFAGVDGQGKRKFVCGTVPTKKDAEKEARRLEGLRYQSSLTLASKETVATYLRQWLENTKKGSVRERTWIGYNNYLRRYLEDPPPGAPPLGRVRMDKPAPEHIQRLYGWMRGGAEVPGSGQGGSLQRPLGPPPYLRPPTLGGFRSHLGGHRQGGGEDPHPAVTGPSGSRGLEGCTSEDCPRKKGRRASRDYPEGSTGVEKGPGGRTVEGWT